MNASGASLIRMQHSVEFENLENHYRRFARLVYSRSKWPASVFDAKKKKKIICVSFNICLKFKYYFRQNHRLVSKFISVGFRVANTHSTNSKNNVIIDIFRFVGKKIVNVLFCVRTTK